MANLLCSMQTPQNTSSLAHSQKLISIVRRPSELVAMVGATDPVPEHGPPAIRAIPLNHVHRSLYEGARLLEAWQHLAKASTVNENTLYNLLIVLIETVPDLSRASNQLLLPKEWGEEANPVRATQAHPRAYKGTKRRPPKEPTHRTIDIRTYLCDPGTVQKVVSSLRKWMPCVRRRLERSGYSLTKIETLERELSLPDGTPRIGQRKHWTLPPRFVKYLWSFVRWGSSRELSELLSLYAELDLEHDDEILGAISLLVAFSEAKVACLWGKVALILPAARRVSFVSDLISTGACTVEPAPRIASDLQQILGLAAEEQFPLWTKHFLIGIRNSASVEYLMAGYRLAARFRPDYRFEDVKQSVEFPEQAVEELAISLAERDSYSGWLPMALWQRCAQLPGLAEVIRDSKWKDFASAASNYFEFLQGIAYNDLSEKRMHSKWTAIRRQIPAIEEVLLSLPATFQAKAVVCLSDWFCSWHEPAEIAQRLPAGLRLLRRLCAPPFTTDDGVSSALFSFLDIDDEKLREQFLIAPDTCLEALEHACVRDNDARLISWGSYTLNWCMAGFASEAFQSTPKKLAKVARTLGGVAYQPRAQILKRCLEHAFFQPDLKDLPIAELCARIEPFLKKEYTNPITARLRAWLSGEANLTAASLERHRRVFSERLIETRLDLIEQSVLEWLKQGFPVQNPTKDDEHALRLLGSLDDNRKGLRKFLRAHWSGDHEYLSRHPETVSWYRKHSSVSSFTWEHGIPFDSDGITLRIERDPLEILKLGTYAGSCLGIGGICAYSSAAVLLDVNKQVLYARNRQGKVVGRQLLAIDDDNRLICFHVYPISSSKTVKALFIEYDRDLASALGLSIYNPAEEDESGYKISSILSVYWWDDDSWDFNLAE